MNFSKLFVTIVGILSIIFSLGHDFCLAEEGDKLTVRPIFNLEGLRADYAFAPKMISVDRQHNEIYVVDSSGKNVAIFDDQGRHLFWFPIGSPPSGIGIGKNGDIFLGHAKSITVLNYRGVFKKNIDLSSISGFEKLYIQSMFLGKDNRLYIGDAGNGRVIILDINGKFLHQFGERGKEQGKILNIQKISVDKERIYILDPPLFKISVFDKKGKFLFRFGIISGLAGGFSMPVGLVVDEKWIYVVDVNRMIALVFDKKGKFLFEFGGEESGKQFLWPGDINVDNNGNIYVADVGNKMVRVYKVVSEKKKVSVKNKKE